MVKKLSFTTLLMKISVDISLYPLREDYIQPIDQFIKGLYNYPGLTVKTHHLSTMIVGEYDVVMNALQEQVYSTLSKEQQASFVLKVLKGDAIENVNLDGYR